MVSWSQCRFPLAKLVERKSAALFVVASLGLCTSVSLSAAAQDSCVSMKTEVMEGVTCEEPSPGSVSWKSLLLGHDVQAYSTVVENQCDQAIQITLVVPGQAEGTHGYARAAAHEPAMLVGCGRPEKPLGWCFESETVDNQCPESLLRVFPE